MRRLLLFVLVFSIFPAYAFSTGRTRIAVLDFKGKGVSTAAVTAVSDLIKSDIVNTRLYQVVEREQINEILKEQGFQQSGCIDQSCAVEIGKLLSAKKILIGKVTKVGKMIIITARIVDVEEGIVEYAAKETALSEDSLFTSVARLARKLLDRIKMDEIDPFSSRVNRGEKSDVPVFVKASKGLYENKIIILWQRVPTASRYNVYRSQEKEGKYHYIGDTWIPYYKDLDVLTGNVYYYKLKTITLAGNSDYSVPVSGFLKFMPPEGIEASNEFGNGIDITWWGVLGAKKYYVYRASSENGEYTQISVSTDRFSTDYTAIAGKESWYKVKAWSSSGYSDFSSPAMGYRMSKKDIIIRDAKNAYYSRGIVPGWGQFYTGKPVKGYLYSGAFVASCAWAIIASKIYNKAKSDYSNIARGASASSTKNIRDDYNDAGLYYNISLGLIAVVYASNWIDILFFSKPDFTKDFSAVVFENSFMAFNVNCFAGYAKEKRMDMSFRLRF